MYVCMCSLNVPTRTRGHGPSVLEHSHLTKLRGQPDGGSAGPLKTQSPLRHTAPPHPSVPAREFPVQNIMMLYSSFLLADADSLDDKPALTH